MTVPSGIGLRYRLARRVISTGQRRNSARICRLRLGVPARSARRSGNHANSARPDRHAAGFGYRLRRSDGITIPATPRTAALSMSKMSK